MSQGRRIANPRRAGHRIANSLLERREPIGHGRPGRPSTAAHRRAANDCCYDECAYNDRYALNGGRDHRSRNDDGGTDVCAYDNPASDNHDGTTGNHDHHGSTDDNYDHSTDHDST